MLYEKLCEDNNKTQSQAQADKIKNKECKVEYQIDQHKGLDENKEMEDEYYCPFKVNDYVNFFNDETVWKIKSITIPTSTRIPSVYADLESYLTGEIMKNVVIYNHFMRARFVNFAPMRNESRGHSFGFGFDCSIC